MVSFPAFETAVKPEAKLKIAFLLVRMRVASFDDKDLQNEEKTLEHRLLVNCHPLCYCDFSSPSNVFGPLLVYPSKKTERGERVWEGADKLH